MDWHSALPWESTPPELTTPGAMAEADRAAPLMGATLAKLMERAGGEIANLVAALHVHGSRIVCLAGPGNNGGDAFVAARVLRARGYPVKVAAMLMPDTASAEARSARERFTGEMVSGDHVGPALRDADVIIDGLFGGGLSRPITGEAAAWVAATNEARATVYAIDVPSGVDGATGAVTGPAIQANRTISFERAKIGHALLPGRGHVGRLTVCEIGMPAGALALAAPVARLNSPRIWPSKLPRLVDAQHKYRRGHLVVVSGPMSSTGAARLAAMAALRAGAGVVTVASPPSALMVNAAHLTTAMVRPVGGADDLDALISAGSHTTAVVIGPGLPVDERCAELLVAALTSAAHVVIDAGAVRCAAGVMARVGSLLDARIAAGRPAVWTPHAGERQAIADALGVTGGKLDRVRALSERLGVVVEKGGDTVIGAPDGSLCVNANAPPWLATAGTGDVLAGCIGALLAQGFPPFEAARIGVWLHGDAACRAGAALIADDLVDALRPARVALEAALPA